MPIAKAAGKLIYFAHVPKCAGSSIEDYLTARFGRLAMLDRSHMAGKRTRWSQTSPQHIPADDLKLLFHPRFFDKRFAVVRDPLARFISAFHHHQNAARIDKEETLESWLKKLAGFWRRNHAVYDGHFRPQVAFIPPLTDIFKLEDGLADVVAYLDRVTGTVSDIEISVSMKGEYRKPVASSAVEDLVRKIYSSDYEALNYQA